MSIDRPDRLRLIEASGTPHEIGVQLGRFGAAAVHRHLTTTGAWASVISHRDDERIRHMADQVQARFPAIFAELSGLAEGLELPFADVFAWNCRGDISAIAPDGCTTVQVPGPTIVIAHNEDGDPGLRGDCGLLHARPQHGTGFTAFIYPGSIPGHAFSATGAGLVQTVNNIRSQAMGNGLPRMVLTRAVLDCATLDEAVTLLKSAERAGAFHVTLAQVGDRRLIGLEFTGSHCSAEVIETPSLHANHLVHAGMAGEPQIITGSSGSRQRRGDALVVAGEAVRDPLAVLRDRSGDLPIRRDDPQDPDDENTLATAVFTIGEDRLDWAVYDGTSELARFHVGGELVVGRLKKGGVMDQTNDPKDTAPRTIEALRDLALDIGRDASSVSLGGKAHGVLAQLVGMPEQAAVRSISELGLLLGVNASTLTRLAKRLGYAGFGDFQSVFREAIADDKRYFYSRQAGRLLTAGKEPNGEVDGFGRLAEETAANVQGFLSQLDPAVLKGAATSLARARRVRVHGVRQFHALASFLTYGLGMLRSDVSLLDAPRLGVAEALSQLEPGDVVVVASCAPYTRSVAHVAEMAAANQLDVIAITDTRSSPLAGPSRHAFFIPHASSFYSNSMGAYVVFCEGLLNLVARDLGDRAVAALAERERLIADMNVEI